NLLLVVCVRQGYEELERQLKEVFKERSNILRQLSKTSKELKGIKVNLQSLKNDEASAKSDVQKLLELGQKQREEMKSLQEAFQKQLNEAAEKAEKQQATINFLKTEMERKSKMIRDLQNENKSLKNKLLSGNKLCGIHAEESKKIQAQLKEFRYGKKDLIFKAQQLTDLEQKLAIAKDKLEKAALDKESQLKALKETVQLCLSSVLHNQPPATNIFPSKPTEKLTSQVTNDSKVPFQVTNTKLHDSYNSLGYFPMASSKHLLYPHHRTFLLVSDNACPSQSSSSTLSHSQLLAFLLPAPHTRSFSSGSSLPDWSELLFKPRCPD
uniref:Leucine zipper protein 2 n=1 Tax=Chelonoidis abingdonii TaxID=106734 RepID=A0A8C0IPU1_CHEAB